MIREWYLFIDDIRNPAEVQSCWGGDPWIVARSAEEALAAIQERGAPALISYDHDMTDAHYGGDYSDGKTGADIARAIAREIGPHAYQVHSLNPAAGHRIADAIYLELQRRGA